MHGIGWPKKTRKCERNRRIMMNENFNLLLLLLTGILLGAMFFGGLWWTVRKGVSSKKPALWFFGSMLLRTSIVLAGFYFMARGHWERLLVCLLGFVMTRLFVMWLFGSPVETNKSPAKEATPAPSSRGDKLLAK